MTIYQTIRDSLVKICAENIRQWYEYAPYILGRSCYDLEDHCIDTLLHDTWSQTIASI